MNDGRSSFGALPSATTVPDPERYRAFPDYPRFPIGDHAELWYSPLTRSARTLSAGSARLLQSCWSFATLPEHAVRLCRELNLAPEQQGAVFSELKALVNSGLLVSHTDLENYCRIHAEAGEDAAPVATVGIPTRNRPDLLERCVGSYLESAERDGRTNDFVIVDDSDDPGTRDRNRAMLRIFQKRYGTAIFYAGPEEQARFADALIQQAGLAPEAVRFGLLNPEGCAVATGSSRNLLLLQCVGDVCLQIDDDTLPYLVPVLGAARGLALSSRYDPTEFLSFNEGETFNPDAIPAGEDLLAVHERLLGRGLGDCLVLHGAARGVDLDQTSAAFFRKLAGGGRILVTSAGVVGDSGMSSSIYFLSLDGNSRSRLLRSEQAYRHTLATHRVARAVTLPTVCDAAFCMALNLGLDNRQLLPPFMPVHRNQDGVFGALVRMCRGDGFFGFLPSTLLHRPPARRRLPGADFSGGPLPLCSGQILQTLLRSISLRPDRSNPAQKLRKIGEALTATGSMPLPDFEEWVRLQVWNQMSRQASQLAAQLRQFGGQPTFWANDVRQVLAILTEGLPKDHHVFPTDQDAGADARNAAVIFQRLVMQLGSLLRVWPDMVEASRDLRTRGVRPASKI